MNESSVTIPNATSRTDDDDDDRKPAAKPSKSEDTSSSHSASSGSGMQRPFHHHNNTNNNNNNHNNNHKNDHKGSPFKKVKPALKKDKNSAAQQRKKEKQLKWDEGVIEEHDLLRGTRMKIDEPNTPYTHYDSGAESDDSRRPKSPAQQKNTLSWDVLQTRLDSVAAVRDAYPSSPSAADTDQEQNSDVEEETRKEMRRLEFKEHRKRHYNEMEALRKFRQEHPEGLVQPDAEENGDDNHGDDDDDDADDEKED